MGQYFIDMCSNWVINVHNIFMEVKQIDFSKTLSDEQVYNCIVQNYEALGTDWVIHQWNWVNGVYISFQDHVKFLIVASLVEKTLNFYHQVNITQTYEQYYSKNNFQIDKFSISELCEKMNLPKETVRRKVLELEKLGVIKRTKKQLTLDRSAFPYVKPENQIPLTSKYLSRVADLLYKNKLYNKKIEAKIFERIIKKNFTLCWRWYYRMQIPWIIGYQKMFDDFTTVHVIGTIMMHQALNTRTFPKDFSINRDNKYFVFDTLINPLHLTKPGLSAMSISDMTNIPRATVIRKCKYLIQKGNLKINKKKQYFLTGNNRDEVLNYQLEFFKEKSKFLTRILNLIAIS